MQKWEYCVVDLEGTKKYIMVASGANGSKFLGYENVPHFSAYLNQLGEQGWEVVTQLNYQIILKRQKE